MKKLAQIATPISLLLLTSAPVLAENSAPPPSARSAQDCTPSPNKGTEPSAKGAPLGKKLAESEGVICPPKSRDSDIKVPPPDSGAKMPVIKPPGNAK